MTACVLLKFNSVDLMLTVFLQLVSHALRFLSTAIRSGTYKQIFEAKETIAGLVERVVVPNVGLRGLQIAFLKAAILLCFSSCRTRN